MWPRAQQGKKVLAEGLDFKKGPQNSFVRIYSEHTPLFFVLSPWLGSYSFWSHLPSSFSSLRALDDAESDKVHHCSACSTGYDRKGDTPPQKTFDTKVRIRVGFGFGVRVGFGAMVELGIRC